MPSDAVWRATAHVRTCQARLDEALAQLEQALKADEARTPSHRPVEQIVRSVALWYGLTTGEVIGPRQLAHYLPARRLAMYLVRNRLGYTWARVASEFQRDHTTVISAVRRVEALLTAGDEETYKALRAVTAELEPWKPETAIDLPEPGLIS